MTHAVDVVIATIGGNCPVQAEGTVNGRPFYFRARGDSWSLSIGGDPVRDPEWEHEEWYGVWPAAGWMPEEEALAFIHGTAARYTRGEPGARRGEDNDPLSAAEREKRFNALMKETQQEWMAIIMWRWIRRVAS